MSPESVQKYGIPTELSSLNKSDVKIDGALELAGIPESQTQAGWLTAYGFKNDSAKSNVQSARGYGTWIVGKLTVST